MPAANAYLEAEVMTASPEQLHLMVVDAALRYARRARAALLANDQVEAGRACARARDCAGELLAAVREQPDPDLARRLRALFAYALRQLVRAEFERDARHLDPALHVLATHRETWLALIERLQKTHPRGPHTGSGAPSSETRDWVL